MYQLLSLSGWVHLPNSSHPDLPHLSHLSSQHITQSHNPTTSHAITPAAPCTRSPATGPCWAQPGCAACTPTADSQWCVLTETSFQNKNTQYAHEPCTSHGSRQWVVLKQHSPCANALRCCVHVMHLSYGVAYSWCKSERLCECCECNLATSRIGISLGSDLIYDAPPAARARACSSSRQFVVMQLDRSLELLPCTFPPFCHGFLQCCALQDTHVHCTCAAHVLRVCCSAALCCAAVLVFAWGLLRASGS